SAWCWPSTADAVRSLTLRPAIRTTAPAISISTFRCGWRAPTRVFLVPCSLSVSLLFCGDGPGGPDFDLFRTLRRDPHRLRTSLLDREPQRDLRTSFLLRRFCFARTVSAGKAEFLHRANWDSYWLVRWHGMVSRHLRGSRRRPPRLSPRAFDGLPHPGCSLFPDRIDWSVLAGSGAQRGTA